MMQDDFEREQVRQAAVRFRVTMRLHQRLQEQLIEQMGMSQSQHRLLMYLYRTDCVPSQTELAQ